METLDKAKPLISHLIELRSCLLRIIGCIFLVFLVLLPLSNDLYQFVATPLIDKLPLGSSMIATEVTAPFFAPFKLSLFVALFISIPYLLYQGWSFIAPGLYANEKKLALPLLLSSICLFYTGISFTYFVILPLLFAFFTTIGPSNVLMLTDINHYLNFILKLFFAFGFAFEIPVATFLMIKSNMVRIETLTANRPYVILAAFVIGMLFTPPEPVSQLLLAIPIWVLFEGGLMLARLGEMNNNNDEQA